MDTMTTTERLCDTHPDAARKLAQRLHRKKEEFEMVRKFYLAEPQGSNEDERSVTARVSTPDVDRDGEIILSEGIDVSEYQKNPVLLWAHRYEIAPIGKALWAKADKGGLICKFQFAPTQFADEVYQLYRGGYMRAFSIGFIPLDYDSKTKTHKRVSLLEVSAVPVPANQNATVMEAYEKGIIKSASLKKDFGIADSPAAEPEPAADPVEPDIKSDTTAEAAPVVEQAPEPGPVEVKAEPDPDPAPDSDHAPEVKSEPAPIDVNLQLLTAVLAAVRDVPAVLAVEMAAIRQDIADLCASIPLLIVPARPEVMGEQDAPAVTLFELQAAVGEIKASIEALMVAPAPAAVEPEPVPEPAKMTPAEFSAAVAEAVKRLDMKTIVKEQTTLALAKLKGKIEG